MNSNETYIYHPVTMEKYSLYDYEGQELLRQLLKSYSLYGGAKKKKKKQNKKKYEKVEKEANKPKTKKEMFFNKELPENYKHLDLSTEIKDFMNTYKKKSKYELMDYLSGETNEQYKIPSELHDAYKRNKLDGPDIEAKHIYNPCMPIKWRDDFMSINKLIKRFFEKHSNSKDVSNELKKILEEEIQFEDEVEKPKYKQTAMEILNRLFMISAPVPFYKLSMKQLADSVLDIIQETITAFAILKTPAFDMESDFDKQLLLYYINYYGDKFYTPILNVYNNIKVAINDAIKDMTKTYKKQNLTEENIDKHLKVIVVGNNQNYNKIMEKIMRFRQYISNKKKEALETNENGRYEEPISYYACVKVDILGNEIFTLSGDEGLLYLTTEGEIKQTIKSIMKQPPSKLISFYAKKLKQPNDKIYITDSNDELDNYYDISLELYIFKLLVNNKIQSNEN
jgi:hypothetical protein